MAKLFQSEAMLVLPCARNKTSDLLAKYRRCQCWWCFRIFSNNFKSYAAPVLSPSGNKLICVVISIWFYCASIFTLWWLYRIGVCYLLFGIPLKSVPYNISYDKRFASTYRFIGKHTLKSKLRRNLRTHTVPIPHRMHFQFNVFLKLILKLSKEQNSPQ